VEFDDERGLFHGEVSGIRDVVTFQGRSVKELHAAFENSVDDYLVFCKKRGEEPEKAYSGRFVIRLTARQHQKIAEAARKAGISLNRWIAERLAA
jgi:predicted HicB family RNase H-like nuclease